MTDPISDEPVNIRITKFPVVHVVETENGYVDCGDIDEQKGFCKTCGIYIDPLNKPEPINDEDIPF